MTHPEYLYDKDGAGAFLLVSPRKVDELVKAGELRSLLIGRQRRFTRAALLEYIERQEAAAVAP